MDMTGPWAGIPEISSPVLTGPLPVWGIVLFLGAAIPGDIPLIGTVGIQPGAEPQTLRTERLEGAQRERIWTSAEAQESGLSVRSRPPRVSAPVGTQLLGSD